MYAEGKKEGKRGKTRRKERREGRKGRREGRRERGMEKRKDSEEAFGENLVSPELGTVELDRRGWIYRILKTRNLENLVLNINKEVIA